MKSPRYSVQDASPKARSKSNLYTTSKESPFGLTESLPKKTRNRNTIGAVNLSARHEKSGENIADTNKYSVLNVSEKIDKKKSNSNVFSFQNQSYFSRGSNGIEINT
jgi:hypothetical protein